MSCTFYSCETRKSRHPSFSLNKFGSPRVSASTRCRSRAKVWEPHPGTAQGGSLEERPPTSRKRRPGRRLGLLPRQQTSWAGRSWVGVLLGGALPGVLRAAKVTNLLGHGLPRERELEWCPNPEHSPYGEARAQTFTVGVWGRTVELG